MDIDGILKQFNQRFEDEEACVSFLYELKWPNGFRCSECGYHHAYTIASRKQTLYECASCAKQTTLTANTLFHKSRTPLSKWLLSLYIVTFYEKGVNAVQLQELLSVTYKTAWNILHKIRQLVSGLDQTVLLSGFVKGKHEILMKQAYPSDAYLEKERSVLTVLSENANTAYLKLKLLTRKVQARNRLSEEEVDRFLMRHTDESLESAAINPRHQREYSFRTSFVESNESDVSILSTGSSDSGESLKSKNTKNTTANNASDYTKHLTRNGNFISDLTARAFSWINDTFHGLGLKYIQHYLDEYCYRSNSLSGSIHDPFAKLSLQALFRAA
ncbi:transposase [Paenibacillus sp. HB172176]|uniref:transposase n=1 Tax=Paenibacillus sp. HB172176 TaxID=2493690 RepID=UPI0014398627|nr:transposase [Paenibacillus sp. HB172176]